MTKIKKMAILGGVGQPSANGLSKQAKSIEPTSLDAIGIVTSRGAIEIPRDQVENAVKFLMDADKIKAAISKQEVICLKTIHSRYCMLNGWPIVDFDVSRVNPEAKAETNPSYYEYWYMFGTPDQYFLMSREIVIQDGNVKLQIGFNPELAREGEND